MFSHIVLGANDIETAKKFYDSILGALGHREGKLTPDGCKIIYPSEKGTLIVGKPIDGKPATHANGGTVGFSATSSDAVDAFYAAGIAAGGSSEGEPGPRAIMPGSYGAYLRDPTGNKLVAWFVKTV